MNSAVREVACRKRLRSCDNAKNRIKSGGDEMEGTRLRDGGHEAKNRKASAAFLGQEKKKVSNSHSAKKMRRNDGEGVVRNGHRSKTGKELSTASFEKEKKEARLKNNDRVDGKKEGKRMRNCELIADSSSEEEMIVWTGYSGEESSELSAPSLDQKERERERGNNISSKRRKPSDDKRFRNKNEENKVQSGSQVKNGEVYGAILERGKKRGRPSNTSEKKVHSNREEMLTEKNKLKSRKVSSTSFDNKRKKEMLSSGNLQKINDKRGNTPLSRSKNKMQNNSREKKAAPIKSALKEKKIRPSESTDMKMRHNAKQKKRNVQSDISVELVSEASSDSNYEKRRREESHTLCKKGKTIQSKDNDKRIHSGKAKDKKIHGHGKEKKRKAPFAFFKPICNKFKEFLIIPPSAAAELEDLTNCDVCLEDSEGNHSKVRLSMVDGSLAFDQGWSTFVSDHLIAWADFLLFEYTAKETFYVRVFDKDSRERVNFNVESKRKCVRKKQACSNRSPDNLISSGVNSEDIYDDHYISGEYSGNKEPETHHVTIDTKDPKRVDREVGSGPASLDSKDGNLVNGQCKTKGVSPLHSKQKRVILVIDPETSTHENEDTVKLAASDADSDKHHLTVNTDKDLKRIQSGLGNESSVVPDDEKGSLPNADCGTKSISLTFSNQKTRASEIKTSITDADHSAHENSVKVKQTAFAQHEEDRSMITESEIEAATPTKYIGLEWHDSDGDLGRKQETNHSNLECTTALEKYYNKKYYNHSKMNINVSGKYEPPGGFRCLEKWRKGTVSDQAAPDGNGLMKPETPQKTDSKSEGEYGAIRLNPVNNCFCSKGINACVQPILTMCSIKPSGFDREYKYEHDKTEIDHSIEGKSGGVAVQPQTSKEQLEPASVNPVVSGYSGAREVNPVVSEGTYAVVESVVTMGIEKPSSPDMIPKCGRIRTEIACNVNGKVTDAQLETKMDQLEPVESIVSSQSSSACANRVGPCQSEHYLSKQEDREPTNCVTPVSLEPTKTKVPESIDHSSLKINLQFSIPNTTQKWIELPKSLPSAGRQIRQDRNVIMLKDPMKRLWPVLYHENPIFVGFTAGWKHFVAANNIQIGDLCELFEGPDEEEPMYSVEITRKSE